MSLPFQHFCAAAVAEATQALARNPFEVIKQNQQIGKYETIMQAGRDIYSHKGIAGFYRGYLSLIMREIPFSGLQFPLYEYLKRLQVAYLAKTRGTSPEQVELKFWNNAINGSLAGSIAGFVITPIDVIKTRRMTADVEKSQISIPKLVSEIYSEAGMRGLYRGAMMRVLYLSFGGSAFFGIYEKIKTHLENTMYD